jgi:hypothetical protein
MVNAYCVIQEELLPAYAHVSAFSTYVNSLLSYSSFFGAALDSPMILPFTTLSVSVRDMLSIVNSELLKRPLQKPLLFCNNSSSRSYSSSLSSLWKICKILQNNEWLNDDIIYAYLSQEIKSLVPSEMKDRGIRQEYFDESNLIVVELPASCRRVYSATKKSATRRKNATLIVMAINVRSCIYFSRLHMIRIIYLYILLYSVRADTALQYALDLNSY